MGTTYTYLVADLRTGTIIDELPLAGVSFDKKLNDIGSFRGQLYVTDPAIRDREPRLLTEPGRTAIYVNRDGELLWGGIIWTTRYVAASGVLEIGAADFLSYFDHRFVLHPDLTSTISYTDVDQIVIARRILEIAQSHDGGNMDLTFIGTQSSPVTRTVLYGPSELKPVAEALRDLANAEDGFDFTVDVRYDVTGEPERVVRFGHPRIGQPGQPHVWEYGANLIDYTWPRDASSMVTRLIAQGTADDNAPLMSIASDNAAHRAGWPLLEDASQVDAKTVAELAAHARGELAARRRPVVLPELTVRADLDPVVGTYSVGDDVRIIIDDPFFADEQLDVTMRLIGYEVVPGDDAGQEEVKLTVSSILEQA
jgi:hypothetical protein